MKNYLILNNYGNNSTLVLDITSIKSAKVIHQSLLDKADVNFVELTKIESEDIDTYNDLILLYSKNAIVVNPITTNTPITESGILVLAPSGNHKTVASNNSLAVIINSAKEELIELQSAELDIFLNEVLSSYKQYSGDDLTMINMVLINFLNALSIKLIELK